MTKEELAEQLSLSMDRDIPEEDIPSLELYMDQILTLVDRELGETRREEGEKLLTKTMVNNYTKEGLLKRIKGKTYSREHIRMLLLVYQMKQALPLQDLKRFLGGRDKGAVQGLPCHQGTGAPPAAPDAPGPPVDGGGGGRRGFPAPGGDGFGRFVGSLQTGCTAANR